MTTIVYLLLAIIVIFIISRVMKTEQKIDACTKMLATLAFGLLLGAGYYFITNNNDNSKPEKAVVDKATASNPTLSHVLFTIPSNTSEEIEDKATYEVMGQETKCDTVAKSIGKPNKVRNLPEIVNDS